MTESEHASAWSLLQLGGEELSGPGAGVGAADAAMVREVMGRTDGSCIFGKGAIRLLKAIKPRKWEEMEGRV